MKILYVDDEVENLTSFKYLFKRDFEVILANSGKEAMAILEEEGDIPIVVSDQRMPEMTGSEFLEKISKQYPDSLRILLTGYSDLDSIVFAINHCQIYRFLSKPFQYEEVKQTLVDGFDLYFSRIREKEKMRELRAKLDFLERSIEQAKNRTVDWKKIAEELNIAVLILDKNEIILGANSQFYDSTQWTEKDIKNQSREICICSNRSCSPENHGLFSVHGEADLIRKDGTRIPVSISNLNIENERKILFWFL